MGGRLFIFVGASCVSHSVRNEFRGAKSLRKLLWVSHMCEIGLGVLNFSHGLRKFRRVCELISQGLSYFCWVCEFGSRVYEISHPMRNNSMISYAL